MAGAYQPTNRKVIMYKHKNNKKAVYTQNSEGLSLQEFLNLIAKHTGFNPKLSGKSYIAGCPAHYDKHPSLSITQGDDGRILIHCFRGCSAAEICASLGIKMKDLFPKKNTAARHG